MAGDRAPNAACIVSAEAVAFAQGRRTVGAMQNEYRFTLISSDVDVCRTMIVGVDDGAQAVETKSSRHDDGNLSDWEEVFWVNADGSSWASCPL